MKLTYKTLESFENWYIDLYWGGTWAFSDAERLELYKSSIFNTLPESMKFGVYVDFFDSVGIYIEEKIDTDWDYERITYYHEIDCNEQLYGTMAHEYKTRSEARTAAVTKANELYNNK